MFYAKSTGGFYTREIHGDSIPEDAVEITAEAHAELLDGQSQGKIIGADESGFPVLRDPQPPAAAELWPAYQASALAVLADSDATVLRCYESAVPVPGAWATYRKALRAIAAAASGDPSKPLPVRPAYPSGT